MVFLLAIGGCDKLSEATQFELDYSETVIIPSATGVSLPFNVISPSIETNTESEFAVNDTRKDMVEQIKLRSMELVLTSPAAGNLGFLESIHIYISGEGLPEVEVAWKEIIPETVGKTLILDVSDTDLQEYIKKDKFDLRVNTVTDEIITSDHHIDVNSVFFVDAKILGL